MLSSNSTYRLLVLLMSLITVSLNKLKPCGNLKSAAQNQMPHVLLYSTLIILAYVGGGYYTVVAGILVPSTKQYME